ncbi:uncharacterized protein Tco025E_04466 [Trypanosoma conorhini]|uniref:Uncharacterized protein n=1 Tax=Trypanosoma conorhini TaxID=83891 RepID=A0A3R7L8P9_9TRYP|nr:uncharacterized protein Tco025E_04466 [Trypanosoma conorhini]RNF18446.1 hypothetical protein Tco025E_04466 [Trypanosoma conorhini]
MNHGSRGSSASVPFYECEEENKRPRGSAGTWMRHFLIRHSDPTRPAGGAPAPGTARWRGSRDVNGGVAASHASSKLWAPQRRSPALRDATALSGGGVATTYDPLSCTRGGRVAYHAEIGQAVVNTAHLLGKADRLRRRTASSVLAGAAPPERRPRPYYLSHAASQAAMEAAPRGLPGAAPRFQGVGSQALPVQIREQGLMALEAGAASPSPSPATPVSGSGADVESSGGALALVPFGPIEGPKKRVSLLRDSRGCPREGGEPVAWRPEHGASDAHRDGAVSDAAVSCSVTSPTLGWQDVGDAPAAPGPTLHYKQLTESFYGNYSSGVLAQEAYLHFVAGISHQLLRDSHGASRRPQRVRGMVEKARQGSRVAAAPHGGRA